MKRIFTLLLLAFTGLQANSQLVLNEFYAIPNNGRHEFFELYNSTVSNISSDSFTLVTYFEDGPSTNGFYVMDLPAQIVAPLGYYVGAAAHPFNYQGILNCTEADFNWNDVAFLAANNGYLRKWVAGNTVAAAIDGNANYDLAPLPANFNDFFYKKGGGNASYSVFLYKNGVLFETFFGGIGGANTVPAYIQSMPALHVDVSGPYTDFTINFSSYTSLPFEYVIQEAGSDNGYIRLRDGFCGQWTKSSATVNHTPGVTNSADADEPPFTVAVSAVIVHGSAATGSTVNYDVEGAQAADLPVTLHVIVDVGSVPGKLDAGDVLVETRIETALNDGDNNTVFFPFNANILIVVQTASGCLDRILFIPNTGVLPVKLQGFHYSRNNGNNLLTWRVSENASAQSFTLERSTDGIRYTTATVVRATTRLHDEQYAYTDLTASNRTWYRLKITERNNRSFYSNVLVADRNASAVTMVQLHSNPVAGALKFTLQSEAEGVTTISVHNATGALVLSRTQGTRKGEQLVNIPLDASFKTGLYFLEVNNGKEKQTIKFLRN